MNGDVRQEAVASGGAGSEGWRRHTEDEPGLRNVEADYYADAGVGRDGWHVAIWVMELVRDDPLESELRQRITSALLQVRGVTSAEEGDREHWIVTGQPSGKSLVEAVAQVAYDFLDQTREYERRLLEGEID
jgi:hypothetical protein